MPEEDFTRPPRAPLAPTQPEGGGLWDAVKARPFLLIVPIIVFVAIGVAVGATRPANYTSEARLAAGRINVATASEPGVVASAYSRAISADQVTKQLEAELGNDYGSITASPIPESPIILIESESTSEAGAIKLANAGAKALTKYIKELNNNRDEAEALLREYESVQAEIPGLTSGPELDAAKLKLESLEAAYRQALSEETGGNDIRTLTSAQEASSDKKSKVAILGLAGLIAGIGVGLLLAYLRARAVANTRRA